MFVRSNGEWVQEARLVGSGGADAFARSVSLSGDRALVGAFEDPEGARRGAAYVFVRSGSTWTREATLVAGDAAFEEYFGYSVSLSGDQALIGSPHDNDSRGAAYVFGRTGGVWRQEAKLVSTDGEAGAQLALAVSLSPLGNRALVGGPGAAYVFSR
ncbi:MAG TPA: hypothetical protein VF576_09080, partial [Rubricoccaceae bacterium]